MNIQWFGFKRWICVINGHVCSPPGSIAVHLVHSVMLTSASEYAIVGVGYEKNTIQYCLYVC